MNYDKLNSTSKSTFLHGYTKDKNAKIKQTSFITLCNQGKVTNRLVINQLLWLRNQLFYLFMHKIKYFLRILIIHGQGQELKKGRTRIYVYPLLFL